MRHISISFAKYSSMAVFVFILDIILIAAFIELLGTQYLVSVAISFIISSVIHYLLVRNLVFQNCERHLVTGGIYYLIICLVSFVFVMIGMYVLVSILGFHYVPARIIIGVFEAVWNFSFNYFLNFKAHRYINDNQCK